MKPSALSNTHPRYLGLGELFLDLRDIDDKLILALNNSKLLSYLKTPQCSHTLGEENTILSVEKIYPRKPVQEKILQSSFTSLRISIEFATNIPDRL